MHFLLSISYVLTNGMRNKRLFRKMDKEYLKKITGLYNEIICIVKLLWLRALVMRGKILQLYSHSVKLWLNINLAEKLSRLEANL